MKKASSAELSVPALQGKNPSAAGLWLWVAAGFLLLVVAWAALFTVARSAKIETVPRATQGGGTR